MADLKQTPGLLNIAIIAGDEMSLDLDFNIDLSTYTSFNASVVNAVTKLETAITVTPVDLSAGKLKLALGSVASAGIPVGKHRWGFRWVTSAGARTILAGVFEVTA